jgi:DNA-binding response OmpR family regulator
MARLLLVEADPFMQRTLQKILAAEDYFCAVAPDVGTAERMLMGDAYDLVVLDVGRLREEGLGLLRRIRSRLHTPVLLLAPEGDIEDVVSGLQIGADDYLCEPFDPRELVGRVHAQLRRADEYSRPMVPGRRVDLGEIVLDLDRHDAFRDGVALRLTAREFELLRLFARHANEPLAADWIFENVWGYSAGAGSRTLRMCIGRLRRKIEADPRRPRLLVSVRGVGYKLVTAGG